MYVVKHNFILGGMYTNTKAQLHISAMWLCLSINIHTTKNIVVFDNIHKYHLVCFVIVIAVQTFSRIYFFNSELFTVELKTLFRLPFWTAMFSYRCNR